MKKLLALLLALCSVLLLAMPAGAIAPPPHPERYNELYYYWYQDFNGDGKMELVTYGGEPGGYVWMHGPKDKIYTNVDGEVKLIECAAGGFEGHPIGFRNRLTGKQKWFSIADSAYYVGRVATSEATLYEVKFDFDELQYKTTKAARFFSYGMTLPSIRFLIWLLFWKADETESFEGTGILTPERIEELLLNPPN